LICFAAIMANWQDIYTSFYQEQEVPEESQAYPELTYA